MVSRIAIVETVAANIEQSRKRRALLRRYRCMKFFSWFTCKLCCGAHEPSVRLAVVRRTQTAAYALGRTTKEFRFIPDWSSSAGLLARLLRSRPADQRTF